MIEINVFCDGGSRGNPGPSAGGVVIKDGQEKIIFKKGYFFGRATNNFAEYRALMEAINWINDNHQAINVSQANIFLDSQLVVKQLRGEYRVKSRSLAPMVIAIQKILKQFPFPVSFVHINREKNSEADELVNIELDRRRV
ncbi:MAG: Ribonuclease H [Candidatus Woesebacteria bacterium GW2011_GWB1_43_14]|uniref:Ribonuclease H n=1 Tax=Candidatus Woesebacteria bacterium GW2011_GWB1_43_14 TaxID=1618578 RepID=A0A0G1GJQ0_9BACT|nr:MAG: Ribonuclease H [Candidatus Woesebacteria bacterium GW2011_GWA1_39_11b]KKS78266.1 MAG: Ribonuclease H [Candidatus Woesebacteria bacterium GW2011_GWC1_42_9]KKS99003.1 MAG: Ribonuclease H [Candidatus Woesebacteria bacterium GW2011_GWB1_43_14]